jgi:hypothetical protein
MFIKPDEYQNYSVDQYFIDSIKSIPIVDIIKIDNKLYGRFDLIIKKYFRGIMGFLPLLYCFNDITDPIEINIGRLIKIPDFDILNQKLLILNVLDDDNVPGIVDMNNHKVNSSMKITNTSTKTTALPKLNITLPKVKYNSETGEIFF